MAEVWDGGTRWEIPRLKAILNEDPEMLNKVSSSLQYHIQSVLIESAHFEQQVSEAKESGYGGLTSATVPSML